MSETDASETAALFRRITLGVYVVGVAHDGRRDAFTAAWLTQVAYDPPLLALSVNPGNASYPLLRDSVGFAVSVLKRGQLELARHFGTQSGRDRDKLEGVRWRAGRTGAPVLADALAYFDCELTQRVSVADRELVIGRVVAGALLDRDARPLAYADTGDMDGSSALYPPAL